MSFALFPVFGAAIHNKGRPPISFWPAAVAIVGLLTALAAISLGRAGFGPGRAKSSRFFETSVMLVPFTAPAWAHFLREKPRFRRRMLIAFWIVCFLAFVPDWAKIKVYRQNGEARRQGLTCIEEFYRRGGAGLCPEITPVPLASMLEQARELNLSFYGKLGLGPAVNRPGSGG
ncbi:MAG: hypothetical protein IIA14_07005 [SAR324 cluster bacterium]|nr:hypothetical protein [SAR324 cluster bacterium]